MSEAPKLQVQVRVRQHRLRLGWSQDELARRSGLSRAGVSAIETGRLVPSTAAALALGAALGCQVEDLFQLLSTELVSTAAAWAWPPSQEPCRYWEAEVAGRIWRYPAEPTPLGTLPPDGFAQGGEFQALGQADPRTTLVVACCDPAVNLLAEELSRSANVRLLVLSRSSRLALDLLGRGLVHAAGVHLASEGETEGNARAVRNRLGVGYKLLRVASWEEGLVLAPGLRMGTVGEALGASLRWVGREEGSGARQCLDELLGPGPRRPPRRFAHDHRGVAEAVQCGWADVGICLRLAGEEAGLDFLSVRREAYDLCFPECLEGDPRLKALVSAVRSPNYRRWLNSLPGYEGTSAGEIQSVGGIQA